MTVEIHEDDTLSILVPVIDKATGDPKDITGATISAVAADIHGSTVEATESITNASEGKFTATFSAGQLVTGKWTFQARVELDGESQVVAEETIQVAPGYV